MVENVPDFDGLASLSVREIELLQLKCDGCSEKQIADALFISVHTVKSHLANIYAKLKIDTMTRSQRAILLPQFRPYLPDLLENKRKRKTDESTAKSAAHRTSAPDPDMVPDIPKGGADDWYDANLPATAIIAVLEDELYLTQQSVTALAPVTPQVVELAPVAGWSDGVYGPAAIRSRRPQAYFLVGLIFVAGLLAGAGGIALLLRQAPNAVAPGVPSPAALAATTPTDPAQAVEALTVPLFVETPGLMATAVAITVTEVPAPAYVSLCGETAVVEYAIAPEFIHAQGVSLFKPENTAGVVLNPAVRTLHMNPSGLWAGYHPNESNSAGGLTLFHRPQWIDCTNAPALKDQVINDIVTDAQGRVWVATEKAGIAMYDGAQWTSFSTENGLPSNEIFGLAIDSAGAVWAATWEGAALFNGSRWDEAYSIRKGTLQDNHLHAIAFDGADDIWLGHIADGVTRYDSATGDWVNYQAPDGPIAGSEVRSILVRPAQSGAQEQVWIATADGGITVFEAGAWTIYNDANGLPSNSVYGLDLDRYGRVWAATEQGVYYFDGAWRTYHTLPAVDVALGLTCTDCAINDEHVWTATTATGLTHSRIPLPDQVIQLIEVRAPAVVAPGESFRPEITVSPLSPYTLDESRGDFLSNIDADPANRFGAYPLIKVVGLVSSGEPFTFTDYDNSFVAPELGPDETERTFTSTWRVWMQTRYVGEPIRITFIVRKAESAP